MKEALIQIPINFVMSTLNLFLHLEDDTILDGGQKRLALGIRQQILHGHTKLSVQSPRMYDVLSGQKVFPRHSNLPKS